mmetsp:Transcript_10588/g.19368  ORF Transcript_10588/g.19368 Transcript_10588/m.19368 type:complete len:305 (-) Transcript_10588:1676-2590(-)
MADAALASFICRLNAACWRAVSFCIKSARRCSSAAAMLAVPPPDPSNKPEDTGGPKNPPTLDNRSGRSSIWISSNSGIGSRSKPARKSDNCAFNTFHVFINCVSRWCNCDSITTAAFRITSAARLSLRASSSAAADAACCAVTSDANLWIRLSSEMYRLAARSLSAAISSRVLALVSVDANSANRASTSRSLPAIRSSNSLARRSAASALECKCAASSLANSASRSWRRDSTICFSESICDCIAALRSAVAAALVSATSTLRCFTSVSCTRNCASNAFSAAAVSAFVWRVFVTDDSDSAASRSI